MSVGKHIIGYTQLLPDVIVFGNILRPLEHSDFVALVLGKLHIALVTLLYAARGWDWYSGIILRRERNETRRYWFSPTPAPR